MNDYLIPFLLNESPIRGRSLRLNAVLQAILARHDYPGRISHLLAETLALAAILGSNLKQNGIFTIQLQSNGLVPLLVADAVYGGALRGYVDFAAENADAVELASFDELFAEGYLAVTLDPGDGGQRYQGVVPLAGESISESIRHYFAQSQQLQVEFRLAVGQQLIDGAMHWVAGAVYIEHMPESAEATERDSEPWREAKLLLGTVKDDELLDTALPLEALLHRLYHEGGVWVYDPLIIKDECRCSREKIQKTLQAMQPESLDEMAINGSIRVDCQFCGRGELFALSDLKVAS